MISGTITISDVLEAQRLHRSTAVRWCYAISGITALIGALAYFHFDQEIGFVSSCAGIGGTLGEFIYSRTYIPWKVRRIYKQQKDFASPFTYTWNSEFIEAQGICGQSKRAWKNYAKFKENENIFLLYHADNIFEMLPKNWFGNEGQLDEFRRFASRSNEV
ncbi:YcxB family protein [Desulfobulbus sp.]|uniref:YcxB family protein n=1 Tax=Desulfobulbus sp. TaxID=895 RepID=UPI00286ED163|nr:YcxB family protein [Desulfobulbus sp.]